METRKCRFCHELFRTFHDVRVHVHIAHPVEFNEVERWLGKHVDKLRYLEQIAQEGMNGYTEGKT